MADLIDRQAAIDALVKAIREDPYYDGNEAINGLGVCDVRVILNDLPSAQPEQKKGEWIVDEKRFGCTERHCSLCGAILEGDDWKWRNNNYCYHCGARMVRGESNDRSMPL